jgi:hypothetical protein
MRLYRFFICIVCLGLFGSAAYSQSPVDPKVIINSPPGDPTCLASPNSICYTGDGSLSEPLVEDYQHLKSFIYEPADPTAHLNSLYLGFTSGTVPPLTLLTCGSDIWANCSGAFPTPAGFDAMFLFSGPGFMTFDTGATVTLQPLISDLPEPTSVLLFGTGLIAIFSGAKRRLEAPQARI